LDEGDVLGVWVEVDLQRVREEGRGEKGRGERRGERGERRGKREEHTFSIVGYCSSRISTRVESSCSILTVVEEADFDTSCFKILSRKTLQTIIKKISCKIKTPKKNTETNENIRRKKITSSYPVGSSKNLRTP
jgi:hypothetical protein